MLVTHTYDNLYALIQQLIGKGFRHPEEAWNQIGQPRVDHHASQLGQFRVFSNRRELLMCHNYTYLRDGQACGYQDLKLSNFIEVLFACSWSRSKMRRFIVNREVSPCW
jgi:hypothetical protein